MNIKNSNITSGSSDKLLLRNYQKKAHRALMDFTKSLIRQTLIQSDRGVFPTASLLEMATGSGKTFTVGKYLELLIRMRDRMQKKLGDSVPFFPGLNILVLTNRIDDSNNFETISSMAEVPQVT